VSLRSRLLDKIPYFQNERNIPLEDIREVALTVTTGTEQAVEPVRDYANAANEGYRQNELVFACIQEYITSASEAVLVVGNKDEDGNLVPTNNQRALTLVAEPNPSMDTVAFLEAMHMQLLIGGNVYLFTPRSAIGTISGMYWLRPDRIRIIPNQMTGAAAAYRYTLNGQQYIIPAEFIGHHKTTDPLNDWYGLGNLQVLAKMVNLDTDATDFARSVFENKGVPAGFLKVARRLNTQDEADQIRRNWHARFAGKSNWQRIGVLDEDASYEQLAPKMGEMAMPDLRNITESRICAAFGVPPIVVGAKVGLESATYSNYAQAKESFWEETLLPAYKRAAAFFTRALSDTPDFRGMQFGFDFSDVRALADDQKQIAEVTKTRAESAAILIRAGYEPDSVSEALQLPQGLVHTGMVPTSGAANTLNAPAEVLALPAVKGIEELEQAVDREYLDSLEDAEKAIQASFNKLGRNVDSILGQLIKEEETEPEVVRAAPTFGINGETLIPFTYDATLAQEIAPELQKVAERTWADVTRAGVLSNISYTSHEGAVLNRLNQASARVKSINDLTRTRINDALAKGVSRGYSLRQIADGVDADNFNGLRNIVRGIPGRPDAVKRARTIARSEVRWAQNQTTALRYKASGVSEVIIRDGDDFDEACAAVDGTRQTIEWYEANPIEHPNCTRGATPVTEGLLE
jgi:HK97 family phage portal protein